MAWLPTFNDLAKILGIDSSGNPVGAFILEDGVTTKTPYQFIVSGIGDIQGEAVELDLSGKGLTRYRFKPSVDMRVTEDAANVAQAEEWLQADPTTWAALAAGELFCRPPVDVSETPWSRWYYFTDGNEITNLWFLTDVASTATATALVEAE